MKRTSYLLILPFCWLLIVHDCNAQTIQAGARYTITSALAFNTWNGTTCDTTPVNVCTENKIKVLRIINGKAIVKLLSTWDYSVAGTATCTTGGQRAGTYCIDESTLRNNVKIPEVLPQYGFLTVPFKYENKSSKLFPSGNIGGMIGIQKRLNWTPTESITWFLVGTAGYSRLALNNTNISDPEPTNVDGVDAFTFGGATGLSFGRFQFLVVKGWDRYNYNGQKSQISWLSIGFGVGFIKPPSEQ